MAILLVLLATFFCFVSCQCNIILDSSLQIADCGDRDATTTVSDLDDFESFENCSTFHGSLYLHTSTDSEYNNITFPTSLDAITGGLYCSGGDNDTTTGSINAQKLYSIGSDITERTTGAVGFVIVDYPTLTSLSFPDLTTSRLWDQTSLSREIPS